MDHPHDEPRSGRPERTVVYVDASGALVDDPAKAAAGEIVESDRLGRMRSRAWFLDRPRQMRMTMAQDVHRDARGEVQIALTLLAVEIDSLAAHWAHRRTRVNGHERRDGQGLGSCSAMLRFCAPIASGPRKGKASKKRRPGSLQSAFPYAH